MKSLVFSTNDGKVRVTYNTDLIHDNQQVFTVLSVKGLRPLSNEASYEKEATVDADKLQATLSKGLHEGTFRIQPTTEQYTIAKAVKFAQDMNVNLDVITHSEKVRLNAEVAPAPAPAV